MTLDIEKFKKIVKDGILKQVEFEEFVSKECSDEANFQEVVDFILEKNIEIKEGNEKSEEFVENGYYSEEIVEQYFHDIGGYSKIPKEEENDIVRMAQSGDEEARERLITSNLKLVAKVAMKYSKSGVNYIDLIQEGTIGLINAIDKYDISKGHGFSSYSVWWVKREIINSIANRINTIKIPSYIYLINKKIIIFENEFRDKNNKNPTYNEIAEGLSLSLAEVEKIKEASEIAVGGFVDGSESYIGDFNTVDKIDEELNLLEEKSKISSLIKKVSPIERKVVEMYYGLGDAGRFTFKEIAVELGMSTDKVKFLKERAIIKLKHASERMWN
jgi:RNA polymerase sigma factor (sigma-70 family)